MIYTFYSYKGGVGRSMTMANVARHLSINGKKVVMIDWDLEAPGIESFFYDESKWDVVRDKRGLIDALCDYKKNFEAYKSVTQENAKEIDKIRQIVFNEVSEEDTDWDHIAELLNDHALLDRESIEGIVQGIQEMDLSEVKVTDVVKVISPMVSDRKNTERLSVNIKSKLESFGEIDVIRIYLSVFGLIDKNQINSIIERLRSLKKPDEVSIAMVSEILSLDTHDHKPGVFPSIKNYIVPIETRNKTIDEKGAGLWLIPAGRRIGNEFSSYAKKVQEFNWAEFYTSYDGAAYFDAMRAELEGLADCVFIDSRTGISEMNGASTRQLADVIAIVFAPNPQNITGATNMVRSFIHPDVLKERNNRPLEVVLIPSRVELSELALRNKFETDLYKTIDGVLHNQKSREFWKLGIPYIPAFNYLEALSVGPTEKGVISFKSHELETAYGKIANYLTDGLQFKESELEGLQNKLNDSEKYIKMYDTVLAEIKSMYSERELRNFQVLAEEGMIQDGKRVEVVRAKATSRSEMMEGMLDLAVNAGLIIYNERSQTIEISHDLLIDSISKTGLLRKTQEEKAEIEKKAEAAKRKAEIEKAEAARMAEEANKRAEAEKAAAEVNAASLQADIDRRERKRLRTKLYIGVASVIVICILVAIFYKLSQKDKAAIQLAPYTNGATALMGTNPTLSYLLALDGLKLSGEDSVLNNIVSTIQTDNYALVENIIYCPGRIVNAYFTPDNTVIAVRQNKITYFDRSGLVRKEQPLQGDIVYATYNGTTGYVICLMPRDKPDPELLYELRTFEGELVSSFMTTYYGNLFAISPDGRHFIAGKSLFRKGNPKPYANYQTILTATSATYIKGKSSFVAGLPGGKVAIYDSAGRMISGFTTGGDIYDVVNRIINGNTQTHYVFAGCNNHWCLYDLWDSSLINRSRRPDTNFTKNLPLKNYVTEGDVTEMCNSGDDSLLLYSTGYTAFVCDRAKDLRSSLINYKKEIGSLSFSRDESQILTAGKQDHIFIWKKIKEYKPERTPYSPLIYRLSKMEGYGPQKVYGFSWEEYNKADVNRLFASVTDYIGSFRMINPADITDSNLRRRVFDICINDVLTMMQHIDNDKLYLKLDAANQKFYFESCMDLVTYIKSARNASRYKFDISNAALDTMYFHYSELNVLNDAGNVATAMKRFNDYVTAIVLDTPIRYTDLYYFTKKTVTVLEALYNKDPGNAALRKQLSSKYGSLSYLSVFHNEADKGIVYAKKGIALEPNVNDWIYTNLALCYLFTNGTKEAYGIYSTYKNKQLYDQSDYFRNVFINDLEALRKAGVLYRYPAIAAEARKIRKEILGDKTIE